MIKKIEFKSKEIKTLDGLSFLTMSEAQRCLDKSMLPGKEKELKVRVEYRDTSSVTFSLWISRGKYSLEEAAKKYCLHHLFIGVDK